MLSINDKVQVNNVQFKAGVRELSTTTKLIKEIAQKPDIAKNIAIAATVGAGTVLAMVTGKAPVKAPGKTNCETCLQARPEQLFKPTKADNIKDQGTSFRQTEGQPDYSATRLERSKTDGRQLMQQDGYNVEVRRLPEAEIETEFIKRRNKRDALEGYLEDHGSIRTIPKTVKENYYQLVIKNKNGKDIKVKGIFNDDEAQAKISNIESAYKNFKTHNRQCDFEDFLNIY